MALPGLARALVAAGKLGQKSAEDLYRKAQANRSSFIAELTGSGAVSASDLAHTMSSAFGAPMLDIDAVDLQRLPTGLLDAKLCQSYRVVVLSKRNNRLIVATADPSDQQAAEKIKFATQMVSMIIAGTTSAASVEAQATTGPVDGNIIARIRVRRSVDGFDGSEKTRVRLRKSKMPP